MKLALIFTFVLLFFDCSCAENPPYGSWETAYQVCIAKTPSLSKTQFCERFR